MQHLRRCLNARWSGGVILGLLATLLVILTIDPSGTYPQLGSGPGITVDESFNVQQGVLQVEAFRAYGVFLIDPVNVKEVFGGESGIPYLPDHPPLGRLVLGVAHHVWSGLFPPHAATSVDVTAAARTGSAVMFGLTVFLVGATAGTWFGTAAGWIAAASLLLMPRVFAHAHIASLETSVNLFVTLAVLCTAHSWSRYFGRPDTPETETKTETAAEPSPQWTWKAGLIPGVYMGLAMLTKIQGFLIIPGIIAWGLFYGRQRAVLPLLVCGVTANVVFFLGWPWLWLDPIGHLQEFLGSATDRVTLNNWYMGQVFKDVETPWHYPWVMSLVTIPVGLLALGFLGLWVEARHRFRDARLTLVLIAMLIPLLLFSTGAAVYDGSRLFLTVFPLGAIFIGRGGSWLWTLLSAKFSEKKVAILLSAGMLLQAIGVMATHPCQLSYYNLLAGGTTGAESLGFEATYWQDSLTREFWQDSAEIIPTGATVHVMPVLHQFQLDDLRKQVPVIRKMNWQLQPWSGGEEVVPEYLIIFNRKADIPENYRDSSRTAEVEVRAGGCGIFKGRRVASLYVGVDADER
ncbi:ArnT family glycosyltransferase [Rubinisphaera margarita]|uniref:ArnT family glycosyltransferase n=1 Tax=Rubinisphaera margarita TaxID=2909586 RepID=UPI001EE914EA|nr:phospholipid carrier-dependent glycosyltransferase [Rubinisphaera margarita]MCG6157570.1 hypothetical protein [Rubinisphaera margarita]